MIIPPVYARCPGGPGKWHWFTWNTPTDCHLGLPPVARGIAPTAAEAEEQAREAAGPGSRKMRVKRAQETVTRLAAERYIARRKARLERSRRSSGAASDLHDPRANAPRS